MAFQLGTRWRSQSFKKVNCAGTVIFFEILLSVKVSVTSAVNVSPLVFTFLSSLASKKIVGYLAASSHLSLSRCSPAQR